MRKKIALIATGFTLVSTAAMAAGTDLIDYTSIASDLTGILSTAIGAAISVGILVLGAKFGWRFFKSFTK